MAENVQKQGRGCFFYGCLTTILVFIGVIAGVYFGTRQAVKYAVRAFTTNAPGPVPMLDITPRERETIVRNLEQRAAAALRGGDSAPLVLGEKELNVWLSQIPELLPFTNQIFLRPAGTQLQAHVSLPLDQFPLWRSFSKKLMTREVDGRYFNGVALIHPGITNGALSLVVTDLLVNGKSLPGDFTGRMKNFDLAANATQDAQSRSMLGQVRSVEIRDSQMIVHLVPGTNVPAR